MRKFKPPASETLPRTRDRDFVSSLFGHIGSKLPFNALFPVLVPSPLHIHVSLSLKEGV